MKQYINSVAGVISILSCFLLAGIGVLNGIEPFTCSYRAVCGAVFVYCVVTIALRIVARIVLTALVDSQNNKMDTENADKPEENN